MKDTKTTLRNALAKGIGIAVIAPALGAVSMATVAADQGQAGGEVAGASKLQETQTVWRVDMRGRPPYNREAVTVPVVDSAVMETAQLGGETVTVWQVDRSGKPPFKRRQVEVPVIDAAVLETLEDDAGTRFRGRPPFKRR